MRQGCYRVDLIRGSRSLSIALPPSLSLVINPLLMVDRMKKLYIVPILISVLMAGCSSGANQASSPPNDANANASSPVAQGGPPTASSSQPTIATPVAPVPPAPKSEANPAATAAAQPAAPATTPGATAAGAPKLVLPLSNIDFGSVYQGKSLTRNLVVRNAGKADLNIESVVPAEDARQWTSRKSSAW